MKEKVIDFVKSDKSHKYSGMSFGVFFGFLILAILDYSVFDGSRIFNVTPIKNIIFINSNSMSAFALGFVVATVIVACLVIKVLHHVIRKKEDFKIYKFELVFACGVWFVILVAYLVTMSCCLWAVSDSIKYFEDPGITGSSQVLQYRDLCSYTLYVDSIPTKTCLNLSFPLSLFGTTLMGVYYVTSDQLRRMDKVNEVSE